MSGTRRQTLACLLAVGPKGKSRDALAGVLGFEGTSSDWGSKLRVRMSRVRDCLPAEFLPEATVDGVYRLDMSAEAVDLWRLVDLANDDHRQIDERDILWSLAGQPLPDVDLADEMAHSVATAKRAQRAIAERFCRTNSAAVSFQAAERLAWLLTMEPYDEELAVLIATCLHRAGRRREAGEILENFIDGLKAADLEPTDSADLLDRFVEHTLAAEGASEHAIGQVPEPSEYPAGLARLRGRWCVGRSKELDRLTAAPGTVLLGVRGSGKTQLLAEVADHAVAAGHDVTYLAARENEEVDFGPFLDGFPELATRLADPNLTIQIETGDTDRIALSTLSRELHSCIEPMRAGGLHYVLVDDGHWLDRRSAALLQLLAHSAASRSHVVVVAGRSDGQEPAWLAMREALSGAKLGTLELAGINLDALGELIRLRHPTTTEQARRELALEVLAASSGIALPARAIIDAADPRSLAVPAQVGSGGDLAWVVERLDDDAQLVGLVAAVLGLTFSDDALRSLCELGDAAVDRAMDRLVESELVYPLDDAPGEYSFQHVLTQESFLAPAPGFQLRRLHLEAAAGTDDPHAKARYLTRAGPPHDTAVAALRRSAELHSVAGQWWLAAKQLRLAEQLDADALSSADYTRFACALDLTGHDGTPPRRRAFELAVAATDWSQALAAAASGLPNAERPNGDQERIDLLCQIPHNELDRSERFEHAQQLARQLALAGESAEALAWADTALEAAETDDERAAGHISCWTACHHVEPGGYDIPSAVVEEARGDAALRIAQMRSIAAIEANDLDGATALHRQFRSAAIERDDSLRIWHSMAFDALLAFERGRWQVSERLSQRAYRYGLMHGHQEATSVHAGQVFTLHFAAAREGDLVAAFDLIPANVRRSRLATASYALALTAAGAADQALELAVELVEDAMAHPRSLSLPVVGLLAAIISEGDPALAVRCRDFMTPFADSSIVVGFGIANMGPLWRYLAPLAESPAERLACLERAVERSHLLGSTSWRVLNGLALAEAQGSAQRRDEARSWAEGTDILDRLL